jgi:hypothetical protein
MAGFLLPYVIINDCYFRTSTVTTRGCNGNTNSGYAGISKGVLNDCKR